MKAVNVLTEFTSATGQTVRVFAKDVKTKSLKKPVPDVTIEFLGFTYNEAESVGDLVKWLDAIQPPTVPQSSSTTPAPPHPAA